MILTFKCGINCVDCRASNRRLVWDSETGLVTDSVTSRVWGQYKDVMDQELVKLRASYANYVLADPDLEVQEGL